MATEKKYAYRLILTTMRSNDPVKDTKNMNALDKIADELATTYYGMVSSSFIGVTAFDVNIYFTTMEHLERAIKMGLPTLLKKNKGYPKQISHTIKVENVME